MPLHKRINIYIKHFRNNCAASSFIIQILEIFPGTRYRNDKFVTVERAKRIQREDYLLKTLRTIYPYSLKKRVGKHDREVRVGKLFFSIPRTKQRYARLRKNNEYFKNEIITYFFTSIYNTIQNDNKDSFYKIGIES